MPKRANVFSNPEEFLVHHMFGRWAGKVKDSFWKGKPSHGI